ncbi:hypothetical protein EDC96DRAFT_584928 [Choanephora cucurbitarum]|nr:hypothetical protein EDC96DRAFT_584928 [Choanephora cucurbitarum]
MSPADRTPRQRRFRPNSANPLLVQLSRSMSNEGPSRNISSVVSAISETTENEPASIGTQMVGPAQEEHAYMDLPYDDQEILESAFDAFEMTGDELLWDDIPMADQNDPMDLDYQNIMPEVPSAIDMNVKVPVNLFTPAESDDILFLDTCRKTGQSVNGSTQFQKFFNYYLKRRGVTAKIASINATLALIKRTIEFSPVVQHEVCKKGCYLYDSDDDSDKVQCPVCKEPRNVSKKTYVKYVSIAKKIAQLLAVHDKRQELEYRNETFGQEADHQGEYFDIFCGEFYQDMKQDHKFTLPLDQGVLLAIDGFTSRKSSKSMMIIHVILLNYTPVIR